jgi:AraC-like DNA-binding protein
MTGLPQPQEFIADTLVAPVFLEPILAQAARRKLDLGPLFRGLDIERADLEAPGAMISHREAITVVRRALPLLAIAQRGLDMGMRTRITERGVLALGLLAAPTLGDAIRLSLRYPQSAGYLIQVSEAASGGTHQLVAQPYVDERDVQDFLVDLTFAALVVLRRQATGTRHAPSKVDFVRAAPENAARYQAFFGCPVHFGCLRNALCTPAAALSLAMPWANAMAFRWSIQLLERESGRLNRVSGVGRTVERAIARQLPRIVLLAEVAASLNVSERTLRRQLADAGLSYRALLDSCRKSRALDLMARGQRSLAQIAAEAGFSDGRAFGRAFKRWTQHSPSQVGRPSNMPDSAPLLDSN